MECAGAVLHPEWVVVAAHCVDRGFSDLVVKSGARIDGGALRINHISKAILHPNYEDYLLGEKLYSPYD